MESNTYFRLQVLVLLKRFKTFISILFERIFE